MYENHCAIYQNEVLFDLYSFALFLRFTATVPGFSCFFEFLQIGTEQHLE